MIINTVSASGGGGGDQLLDTTLSIAPADWNSNTREAVKTVTGVSADNKVYVFAMGDVGDAYCKSQAANQLTFGLSNTTSAIPSTTLNFSIQIINPV